MSIATFLFDLDGTLVDSVADIATSVNLLRKEVGLEPLNHVDVGSRVGDGARRLVERSLPEGIFSDEYFRLFLLLYEEHVCERTYLYPGILDFLKAHPPGRLAVVTNKPTALSEKLLEKLGVRDCFAAVLGPECCLAKKPDPAPVLEALRMLKADPETAVMIGDHHTDLMAGQAAGIKTCFCNWGSARMGASPTTF